MTTRLKLTNQKKTNLVKRLHEIEFDLRVYAMMQGKNREYEQAVQKALDAIRQLNKYH